MLGPLIWALESFCRPFFPFFELLPELPFVCFENDGAGTDFTLCSGTAGGGAARMGLPDLGADGADDRPPLPPELLLYRLRCFFMAWFARL